MSITDLDRNESTDAIAAETAVLAARRAVAGGSMELADLRGSDGYPESVTLKADLSSAKLVELDALPPQLGPWGTGSIVFNNGVPVGGWAELTLFNNGNYRFRGHFHVSGAPSYNVQLAWAVRDNRGRLYMFSTKGHLAGTFEPGSRDHNWDGSGHLNDLAGGWGDLNQHWNYQWNASVNWDVNALINQVKSVISAVGTIVQVISVVV